MCDNYWLWKINAENFVTPFHARRLCKVKFNRTNYWEITCQIDSALAVFKTDKTKSISCFCDEECWTKILRLRRAFSPWLLVVTHIERNIGHPLYTSCTYHIVNFCLCLTWIYLYKYLFYINIHSNISRYMYFSMLKQSQLCCAINLQR